MNMVDTGNAALSPTHAASPSQDQIDLIILATKVCGVVKWFSVKNGYGFVSTPSYNEDIFVHSRKIKFNNPKKLHRTLAEGETIEFDIVQGDKGHEAINVTGPDGCAVQGSQFAANKSRHVYGSKRHRRRGPGPQEGQGQGEQQGGKKRRRNRKNRKGRKSASPKEGEVEVDANDKVEVKASSEVEAPDKS